MVMIQKERLGILFTLVGPGGVGKNALLNEVRQRMADLRQLPTATTRAMRPNEQQGREHLFVSLEEFQQMIEDNDLLEHQEVHPGKFYGIPRTTVNQALNNQQDLIADIDTLGAAVIQSEYPDSSVIIFVTPPSADALLERLKNRNANATDIEDRLNRFPYEMLFAPLADYVIVNDDMAAAVDELVEIIQYERSGRSLQNLRTNIVTFSVELACGDAVFKADILKRKPEEAALELARTHLSSSVASVSIESLNYITSASEFNRSNRTYHVTYQFAYQGS